MSYRLETLNRGGVEPCGIVFGDAERIRVGDLPAMPLGQFAEYSADTLIQIISSDDISSELKDGIRARIAFTCGRMYQQEINNKDYKLSSLSNPNPMDELVRQVRENLSPSIANEVGNPERPYSKNPFILETDRVNISNFYSVAIPDFVFFATEYLAGGMGGFHKTFEFPEKLKESERKLMRAVLTLR